MPVGINYNANPNLINKRSLEVLDYLLERCREMGLWVVLARYLPGQTNSTDLWYTEKVPGEKWIADWKVMVQRYKTQECVIALDLHNEPGGRATWGNSSPLTDWNTAATNLANIILDI